MSTAAIFDKQELQSQQDLLKVGQLLDEALAEFITGKEGQLAPETKDQLVNIADEVARQIEQFLCFTDASGLGTPLGGLRSPMLPPLSPPPMDAEVSALEAEVTEATTRVAELRSAMQARIQQQLAEKLTKCQPTADWTPPRAPTATTEDKDQIDGPSAEELRSKLGDASTKMPGLRAQLEDAHTRMERVLNAAEAQAERPPPNTVERAVLGIESEEEEGAEVSTALKKAMQTGRLSMRRGRESNRAVAAAVSDEEEGEEEEGDAAMKEAEGNAGAEGEGLPAATGDD